jgi:predicted nucleic acid-binding protein
MSAFWDTSAILHICVPGQASSRAKFLLRVHSPVVWWTAPAEVRSALERLRLESAISATAYAASNRRLAELLASWREIQPAEPLRDVACNLLERLPLRASDALHLAAALVWSKQIPRGRMFICNDRRLNMAARSVGFDTAEVT